MVDASCAKRSVENERFRHGLLGAAALLLWVGWSRERRVPDTSELQAPAEQQKVLTAAAVDRLRAVFSAGACQSIYDKADQHFRSQTEVDWLYECNRLRDNLGIWHRFDIHSTEAYGTRSGLFCSKDRPYLQNSSGALG